MGGGVYQGMKKKGGKPQGEKRIIIISIYISLKKCIAKERAVGKLSGFGLNCFVLFGWRIVGLLEVDNLE